MALGVRSYNTGSVSNGTSISVTKPSGTASGDYLLGLISKDDDDAPVFSGFTDIAGAGGGTTTSEGRSSYKVAGGSEPASYSISWTGTEDGVAMVLAIQDTTGIDVTAEDVSSLNRTSGSVSATVTNNGSLAILYAACEDAGSNFTAPDGTWTQVGTTLTQGSGVTGASMAVWQKSVNSGATGTLTVGSDANQELIVGLIVFAPSATGAYTLTASTGSFSLAGNATALKAARKLTATSQSYSFTGVASALRAGRRLTAVTASYAMTGTSTGLSVARKLLAGVSSYALTGNAAGLAKGYSISAAAGDFSVTGVSATLAAQRKLLAATAGFSLTENDVNLVPPSASYTLSAGTGAFSLTGNNVRLAAERALTAGDGAFSLTGGDASLRADRKIPASSGGFALTGNDTALIYTPVGSYVLLAEPASFAVTGNDVVLTYEQAETSAAGIPSSKKRFPKIFYLGEERILVSDEDEEAELYRYAEQKQAEQELKQEKPKKRGKRRKSVESQEREKTAISLILDDPSPEMIEAPGVIDFALFMQVMTDPDELTDDDVLTLLMAA